MWYLLELLLDAKAGGIALKVDAGFEKTSKSSGESG